MPSREGGGFGGSGTNPPTSGGGLGEAERVPQLQEGVWGKRNGSPNFRRGFGGSGTGPPTSGGGLGEAERVPQLREAVRCGASEYHPRHRVTMRSERAGTCAAASARTR